MNDIKKTLLDLILRRGSLDLTERAAILRDSRGKVIHFARLMQAASALVNEGRIRSQAAPDGAVFYVAA